MPTILGPLNWSLGPPPHVGWWQASACRARGVWRWWNGKRWSWAIADTCSPEGAGRYALKSDRDGYLIACIEWNNSWPKNARVPRINPETGEVTGAISP